MTYTPETDACYLQHYGIGADPTLLPLVGLAKKLETEKNEYKLRLTALAKALKAVAVLCDDAENIK